MAGTLRRIQELFQRGEVITIDPPRGEPFYLWVAKLNALEKDECIQDARQARALRMLAFDRSENEQAALTVMLDGLSDTEICDDLLRRKAGELLSKASDEVRSDKKWSERLEAIDRAQIATSAPAGRLAPEEASVLADLVSEFQAAIQAQHQKELLSQRREYQSTGRPDLLKEYRDTWREMLGATAFYEAKRQSEIWYALHECEVTIVDGEPALDTVKVGALVCAERDDVNRLPDEITALVVAALDREMTARDAGNSDAPPASSGSSERPSAAGDSTPSTPTGM